MGIVHTLLIVINFLLLCLRGFDAQSKVSLVTYVDKEFQLVVSDGIYANCLYAEMHNYNFIIFNDETSPQSSMHALNSAAPLIGKELDPRWEKVAVLLHLMPAYISNATRPYRYLCWFDADTIFLDHSKPLTYFIDGNPSHDIIISAEYHAETGVANTGIFLIRCSNWSLSFLQSWWEQDHSIGHDQILFDRLYKSLWPGINDHVKVLPANELNTLPPAYNTLQPTDFILHLMGERNDYRQLVFSNARKLVDEYLDSHGKASSSPINLHQLGINRTYLSHSFYNLTTNRISTILSTLFAYSDPQSVVDDVIAMTEEYRELMLQQYKVLHSPALLQSSFPSSLTIRIQQHQFLYKYLQELWTTCTDTMTPLQAVKLLNLLGMIANDLLQEIQQVQSTLSISFEDVLQLYGEAESWLELLMNHVARSSQPQVYAMLAILLQNKALYLFSQPMISKNEQMKVLHLLRRAVDIYDVSIPRELANKYQHAMILQFYGNALVQIFGDHNWAHEFYLQSCELWESLLFGESTWKEDHSHYLQLLQSASSLQLPFDQGKVWGEKLDSLANAFPSEVAAVSVLKELPTYETRNVFHDDSSSTSNSCQQGKSAKRFRRKKA